MKYATRRLGTMMALTMLAGVATGCGGAVAESGSESVEATERGDLGEPCENDHDCVSGTCDDVSGNGAICLRDVEGDVTVTCLQDDGTLACAEDLWSEARFVRTIDGNLQVGFVTESVDVVLPHLREVTGSVVIGESTVMSDVVLDGLTTVGGGLEIGFSTTTGVSFARLGSVGASLRLASMSDATAVSMPSLRTVGSGPEDQLSLWVVPSLEKLDISALERVDGDLAVTEAPSLSADSLALLRTVTVTGSRHVSP